ncbi:MAG: glycosyltransferase family 61 protein [Flavobacteriales bacterium]|nr:glycosyltransferase family 61 protein [Flavobacteriales bacterium]
MNINAWIKSAFWKIEDVGVEVLHRIEIKPFEHFPTEFTDERVNVAVKYHNEKWFHNEIIVKAKNALVEPQYGYAIDGLDTIIGTSIRTRSNLPSPIPTLKAKLLGSKRSLDRAILFDGSMGINYFHFLSDVLHKVYLLEAFMEMDCPLLVGRQVFSKPFFQFFITQTELSKLNWQPIDLPVQVEELFIARPMPYGKEHWLRTKQLFIKQDATIGSRKAVFVNRTGTRHITNWSAVEKILNEHSIEIVDPGNLDVKQQAELFNSASHVIGIHGAGMTNLAFCNHSKVKVLELCSNNRIGTQYYWLCQALGIDWDMMLGGTAEADQSFELNPTAFEERLKIFLAN